MQHPTHLSALAVSVLVWVYGVGRSPASLRACFGSGIARHLGAAALIGALGFLVTWPSSPPFSEGHGLGAGVLIGALAAGLSLVGRRCAALAKGTSEELAALGASIAPAVSACVLAIVLAYGSRVDALCGVALGWLAAVLVSAAVDRIDACLGDPTVGLADVFAGSLVAACVLAVYRGAGPSESSVWLSATLVTGATVALAPVVASALSSWSRIADSRVIRACAGSVLVGLAAYLASTRVLPSLRSAEPDARLLTAALVGLLCGVLLMALEASGTDRDRPWGARCVLPVMLGLAASTAAHQALGGSGIGFAALSAVAPWLAGWPVPSGTERAQRRCIGPEPRAALLLLAGFLVSRAISVRFGPALRPFALPDHYAMVGVVIGLCLPLLAGTWMSPAIRKRPALGAALPGMACVPVAVIATVVLWGPKVVFALALGLAISTLAGFATRRSDCEAQPPWEPTALASLTLLGLFALLQWTGMALPSAELTRVERAKLVALLGCVPAALLVARTVASAIWARRSA